MQMQKTHYLLYENWMFFIWAHLNPFHLKMHYAKFGWNWLCGFLNFVNVFTLFRNYLPLEKGRILHLNKLESPSSKDALCQVWLKLALWFWRSRWKCEKFTTSPTTTTTTTTITIGSKSLAASMLKTSSCCKTW